MAAVLVAEIRRLQLGEQPKKDHNPHLDVALHVVVIAVDGIITPGRCNFVLKGHWRLELLIRLDVVI